MFEKAVRMKLRFATSAGQLGVEDMWDLSVEQLDTVFKYLNRQAKAVGEESLLDTNEENEVLSLQIAIVRHIVETKLAEKQERENAAERAERKYRLLEILADKEDKDLRKMSKSELRDEIEALS